MSLRFCRGTVAGRAETSEKQANCENGRRKMRDVMSNMGYQLMDAGQLAYVKVGRCRRIPQSSLDALIDSHRIRR